ncbi:DAZ-associated protein 2 [Ammospiza maritima maritima]
MPGVGTGRGADAFSCQCSFGLGPGSPEPFVSPQGRSQPSPCSRPPPGTPRLCPCCSRPPCPEPAYPELYRLSFVPLGTAGVPPVSPACPGASLYLPLAPPLPLPSPVAFVPLGQVYPAGPALLLEGGVGSAARLGTGGTAGVQPPPAGCPPVAAPVPVPPGAAVLLPPRKGRVPGGNGGGFGLW